MKLKTELVLLSLKMIFAGFVAEYVKKALLYAFYSRNTVTPYFMYLMEKLLHKSMLCFINTEKAYNILIHHKKELLQV